MLLMGPQADNPSIMADNNIIIRTRENLIVQTSSLAPSDHPLGQTGCRVYSCSFLLFRKVVDLQSDRACACSLASVDNLHRFTIPDEARSFHKHSFFYLVGIFFENPVGFSVLEDLRQ